MEHHYHASFLSSFPPKLRRLDDRAGAGGSGMVEGPDLDKAVFVRCLGISMGSFARTRNGRAARNDFDDDDMNLNDDIQEAQYRTVSVHCGYTARSEDEGQPDRPNNSQFTQTQTPREDGERVVEMRRGDIWMVRWSAVREAVQRGECELL